MPDEPRQDDMNTLRRDVAVETSEGAARVVFALVGAVLEMHRDDPKFGQLVVDRLAFAAEGTSGNVTGIVRRAARSVAEQTGCHLPSFFAPN